MFNADINADQNPAIDPKSHSMFMWNPAVSVSLLYETISWKSLGEGRFYGHEGVMILVADDIFMKMSFPYV